MARDTLGRSARSAIATFQPLTSRLLPVSASGLTLRCTGRQQLRHFAEAILQRVRSAPVSAEPLDGEVEILDRSGYMTLAPVERQIRWTG